MESKMLLIHILLIGVAVAQTGRQQTFSLSDPNLQQAQTVQQVQPARQVQPVQQVRNSNDVVQRALQHQQPQAVQPTFARVPAQQQQAANTQTLVQENQSFKFINTRSQVSPQVQQQPSQPSFADRSQAFAPQPLNADIPRSQPLLKQAQPLGLRTAPTFQQVPVDAVAAPVQQHDAQVFSRRPTPGTHSPAISVPQQQLQLQQPQLQQQQQQQPQMLFRQPTSGQETFNQQQQFQEQSLTRPQQDFSQFQDAEPQPDIQRFQQSGQQDFQQVPHTRPTGRSRGPPAVPQQTVRRPVTTAVRTAARPPPTLIQVADGGELVPVSGAQDDGLSEELFREQAQNAKYTFTSAVDDRLTDNSQVRQETRDGLNLSGLYSYSDGFFRRTVHYEADQNGYRVTQEDVEPIGNGPQPDPAGSADVATQVAGADVRYTITADDIHGDLQKQQRQLQQQQLLQPQQQQQQQQFQQGEFTA